MKPSFGDGPKDRPGCACNSGNPRDSGSHLRRGTRKTVQSITSDKHDQLH